MADNKTDRQAQADWDSTSQETRQPPSASPQDSSGLDDSSQDAASDSKAAFKPTRSFLLAFSSLLMIALAVALDATSMSVALPTISSALGGSALEAFWSGTSFLLASTVLQPTAAALSNIFGRKYVIYVSGGFFAAGSLIGALANNFTVLIVGRTIQGVGGGAMIALTEVVITDLVPLAFRPSWFSALSGMWSLGTVGGPLVGAAFAEYVTWRWIFYINLPMIGVGLVFVVLFLHQAKIPGGICAKMLRFDWGGSLLFTASSTAFLYGLSIGGVSYPWRSYRVLLPLILGLAGMAVFAVYEVRVAREPIIDRRIFSNRDMVLTYVMAVLHGCILWSLMYFLPLYYEGVLQYRTMIAGVALLPETLTVAPAALVVGILAGITGHYRWSLWIGWALTTFGSGLLLLLQPTSSVAAWVFLNIPLGIGAGMLFPGMALSIQAACEPALNAQAAAFFSFLRTFGESIGVAISGVIFQNSFKQKLLALPDYAGRADAYSHEATAVVAILQAMPAGPAKDELVHAYNESLHTIYISMIAFSAFCLVLSVFVHGYSLEQEHVTDQGLVVRETETEKTAPAP